MAEKELLDVVDGKSEASVDIPPSPSPKIWMLKWLHIRRGGLLDGLQNVAPAILDHLVQEGHIDPLRSAVYQEIMSDATVPLQKARKLLDWLSSQPSTVFWTFQQAICQSGLPEEDVQHLVVSDKEIRELTDLVKSGMSVSDKLSLTSGRSVLNTRETLQKFYRSRDKLLMSAGLAKGKTMTMDKILVNICLLSTEEVQKAFEERPCGSSQEQGWSNYLFAKISKNQASLLGLEEVFRAKEDDEAAPEKVLVTGGAGCGKSTCFTRKAPYEWAYGRLWKQFVLLFCLEFRDKSVWKALTMGELLKLARLGLSPEEQEEVLEFVTSHPEQVVLICDGLDEGSVDEGSLLWSLLNGNCAGITTGLRIIVISRPCDSASDLSQSDSFRGVEVIGFTNEDVAVFSQKYVGADKAAQLLACLEKQPFLAGLMHAPLFCLLVCDLFKETGDLPSRRTDIFEKIVAAILQRYAKARGIKVPFKTVAHAPASLRALIMSLGKLAFDGLQEEQLYFTDVKLEEAGVVTEALQLGFMMKCESTEFWKRDEYTFSHLTMQEFLAALYASSEASRRGGELGKLAVQVKFKDSHLDTFWVFLAGLLDGDTTEAVISRLPKTRKGPISNAFRTLLIYRYLDESYLGRTCSPSHFFGRFLKRGGVSFERIPISDDSCALISRVLQCYRGIDIPLALFSACSLSDEGLAQLLTGLQSFKSIRYFHIPKNDLGSSSMSHVSAFLSKSGGNLTEVNVSDNGISDEGLAKLAVGLKQCKALESLSLENTHLTPASGPILRDVVSCLPQLKSLQVARNNLGDSGLQQLAGGLQLDKCPPLRVIDLRDAKLSDRSVQPLVDLMASFPLLEKLSLLDNGFSEDGLAELRAATGVHPHLKDSVVV